MQPSYTRYPRATLWLLRDGEACLGGSEGDAEPAFVCEVDAFYISKAPITNEQFEAFRPDSVRGECSPDDESPAVGIRFHDALAYCRWYSELTGKAFRLPTEVEWEYACRSNRRSRYFFGDTPEEADAFLWDSVNSGGQAPVVESLRANPFGLHDMLGTVWEWTLSLHLPYPVVPGDGRDDLNRDGPRVLRGGSYRNHRDVMGCGVRRGCVPDARHDDVGFRIVRLLE